MPSKARTSLDDNLKDVKRLMEFHSQAGGDAPGRRYNLEVLNKSAIVLITSYWEAYCEDIASEALEYIVANSPNAAVLPKEIKKIVAKEIKAAQNELEAWSLSDDGWRAFLRSRLETMKEARDRKLNTPKYGNIDDLFRSAIGLENATGCWNWSKKLTAQKAREKLDKYVSLRGEIAHRGNTETAVTKVKVEDYLEFVSRAAAKTGGAVNKHVKAITGETLF
jgi:hypothetical protein